MNFVVGASALKRRLQLLALILFCGASSGFYLINDIADVESDRQHPVKSRRPISSGLVSIPSAFTLLSEIWAIASAKSA